MVRVFLFIVLFSFSPLWGALQYLSKTFVAQTVFEEVSTSFVEDVHSSGVAFDDGIDVDVPLGFSFPFNGTTYTTVDIDSNAYLVFGNDPRSVYTNQALPQSDKEQSIYPYWDDLNVANGGKILYGTLGSGEDIHFVVSWESVPQYPSYGSFSLQVILYKDGSIRFRYDDSSSVNGASGTVGVQESSSNYDQHIFNNSAVFDATQDIFYRASTAKLSLFKSSCVLSDLVNGSISAKRIPGATLRYSIEINNTGALPADNIILTNDLSSNFKVNSIENLQIQNAPCDCLGVAPASNNGINGTSNGVNPILLDFGTIESGSNSSPTQKCGYFEVQLN